MKNLFKFVGFIFATFALFHLASCKIEGDTYYATSQIDSADVESNAYPGANVLTWKAVKDASSYSVYKTTGDGKIEELVSDSSTNTYYIDTKIEQATTYKYRVVSYPKDSTVHDVSQIEVTLKTSESATDTNVKGTWAPNGTSFQSLAEYEKNYDKNEDVLSASTITETLVANTGSVVRVKFPVKPYAYYQVYLAQKNGSVLNNVYAIDDVKTVYGYNFNKTATVDLQAVYTGEKEVTVKAIPLNSIYGSSTVVSSSTITVTDYDKIASAISGYVNAKWTNYNSYTKLASSRVYFTPSSFNNAEFGTSEYTVYRAVIGSSGESYSSGKYVYNSVEKLGNPSKDSSVSTNGDTVYYYDDSLTIEGESDVSAVRYYVILNHDGKIKSASTTLTVPNSDDDNWNFTKDTDVSNNAYIYDIYVNSDGKLNVSIRNTNYATVSFSYGAFDTYNKASVAVETELSSSITFDEATSYSLEGTSSETLTADKYYAFRLVATKTGADDVVKTVIAVLKQSGSYYYLDVKSGSDNIYNYRDSYSIYVTANKSYGSTTFDSVTLSWSDYSALGYNVYRSIFSYSSIYHYYTLLTSTTSSLYTDSSDTLKATSLDDCVYYKVEKVGYYGTAEYEVNVSGLKAPEISLSGSEISWSSVNDATRYYIYRATSQSALESSSNYDYVTYTTDFYYSAITSYTSDYYYAVRAYNSSKGGYSKLSNVVKVEKADAPVVQNFSADFYSFNGSSYTYTLSWDEPSIDYSNYYYILRYQTDSETTADYVKSLFESSTSYSNSYQYSSTSSTSYQVTPSTSYTYTYYAVATRVYDDSSSNYVWSVSNVGLLSASLGESLYVSESSGTYTLSWDAIEGAASYAVYSIGKSSLYLYTTDLIDSTTNEMISPAETVTTTTATVIPGDSYTYHYFFVVALDSNGEPVGMTDIVRE